MEERQGVGAAAAAAGLELRRQLRRRGSRHLSGRLALPVRAEEGAGADASLGGLVGALLVEGGRDAEDGAWRGVGRGEGRGEGRGVGRGEGRVPQSGMTSYAGPVASCVRV